MVIYLFDEKGGFYSFSTFSDRVSEGNLFTEEVLNTFCIAGISLESYTERLTKEFDKNTAKNIINMLELIGCEVKDYYSLKRIRMEDL